MRILANQTIAGALAKAAGVVIEAIGLAKLFEQTGGIQRRMGAAGFFVDEDQAECAGP